MKKSHSMSYDIVEKMLDDAIEYAKELDEKKPLKNASMMPHIHVKRGDEEFFDVCNWLNDLANLDELVGIRQFADEPDGRRKGTLSYPARNAIITVYLSSNGYDELIVF